MGSLPFSHSIYLEVNPPDTRHPKYKPQSRLFAQRADRKPLQNKKIAQYSCKQDWQADEEEKNMEGQIYSRRLRRDRQERRNAGT